MNCSYAILNDRIYPMVLVLHGTHGNNTDGNNTDDAEHLPIPYIPHRLECIDDIGFCSLYSTYKSTLEDLFAQMCT